MDIDLEATRNIDYQDSYVAFLDVLGFKELVLGKTTESQNMLASYFGIVGEVIKYLNRIPSKKDIGSIVISDSIIFSVPLKNDGGQDNLQQLCIAVGLLQQHLALKNIWLRGGISFGKTYFDKRNNQIVGPAYINAFELESKIAKYPRVVLDSAIIAKTGHTDYESFCAFLNEEHHGGIRASNWGKNIIYNGKNMQGEDVGTINKDVPLFIDYLSPLLQNQKPRLTTVVNNLTTSIYKNGDVYAKFRWVADYLISVCQIEIDNSDDIFAKNMLATLRRL